MRRSSAQVAVASAAFGGLFAGLTPATGQIVPTYDARWVEVSYALTHGEDVHTDYRHAFAPQDYARLDADLELSRSEGASSADARAQHYSVIQSGLILAKSTAETRVAAGAEEEAEACMSSNMEVEFSLAQPADFQLRLNVSGSVSGWLQQTDGDFHQDLDYGQETSGALPAGSYHLYLSIDSCTFSRDDSSSETASYDLTLLVGSAGCANYISMLSFRYPEDMLLVGDAQIVAPTTLRLTPAESGRSGAAWHPGKVHLADGFDLRFQFQLTGEASIRGDGFAFVIQDEGPFAIGSGGSGMGYAGIERSLAVEFDTFAFGGEFLRDHVSVQTQGIAGNSSGDAASIGHAVLPSTIADGLAHTCKLIYSPGQLDVYLDEMLVLSAPVNLQDIGGNSVLDHSGCARIGFTAGTGAAFSSHDILNLSLNVTCTDAVAYPHFADAGSLKMLADAAVVDPGVLHLTPAEGDRRGAAWHNDMLHLSDGFTTEFTFRISTDDPPADGMAFVIQAEGPDALGGGGHAMGYAENDVPAIASHLAVVIHPHWWDPGNYDIRIDTDLSENGFGEISLGYASLTGNIWDGLPHTVRITYRPGEMQVCLDGGEPVLEISVHLDSINGQSVISPEGCAWVGFTAATGGFFSSHDVLSWWLSGPCLNPPPGDYDGDCDIDLHDLGSLQDCAQGPAIPYSPGCEDRDLDLDGDVDQVDFGVLQRCLSGSGVPADPACASLPPAA